MNYDVRMTKRIYVGL